MSEQVEATEDILEGASEVAEGVVQMARGFSGLALSGAFLAGAGLGGVAGYFLCKRQLETKYRQISIDEITAMREHYHRKTVAQEEKGDLEDIVRERGYSQPEPSQPPMAVTPPSAVVEAAQEDEIDEYEVEETVGRVTTGPPVVPEPSPEVRNAFEQYGDDVTAEDGWNWHKERSRRSPVRPYVIHVDEREEYDNYEGVTFTYYDADDVLCNERDEIVDQGDRDRLIGEQNLNRFGHGSDDEDVVYVRNDKLEMIFEIVRSPNSYAEDHGLETEIRHSDRRNKGRPAFDDE